MEDFVPEAVLPREDDEVIEEKQNPESANGNGFINHIISNLVTPKSDVDDEENKSKQAEKETTNGGEEKSGGLFGHIISNLVTPSSPKTGNVEAFDGANESGLSSQEEVDGGGSGGGGSGGEGGGAINKFMSNLFHHYEGETGEENKKKQKVEVSEDENKVEKTEDGGGIIDNIVSQLPTSLPDDAAPTSDEATILIHIVQD